MQPDRDKNEWQQPSQQLSQAPYATVSGTPGPTPVVSLASEAPPAASEPERVMSTEPVAVSDNPAPMEDDTSSQQPGNQPVRWQAHEYIHHEKNRLWFVIFAVIVVALMLIAIFLIQSLTFAILIPVMAAALIVYSHRPPRVLNYTLSGQGLHINDRLYPFSQFKGFGVIRDGEEYSVMLLPVNRFQPGVSVYFPEEAGEAIVDMLGVRLPMQELHLDVIDRIIRKLRI